MGGNIESGRFDQLMPGDVPEFTRQHHERVDRLVKKEDRERRHDEGPPIFRVGEIVEVKGMRLEVMMIDSEALVLMPLKG